MIVYTMSCIPKYHPTLTAVLLFCVRQQIGQTLRKDDSCERTLTILSNYLCTVCIPIITSIILQQFHATYKASTCFCLCTTILGAEATQQLWLQLYIQVNMLMVFQLRNSQNCIHYMHTQHRGSEGPGNARYTVLQLRIYECMQSELFIAGLS